MGRYISNANTNSYQDDELLRLKQGFAKNRKEFLTTGAHTWTIDHDVIVRVRVWGGGGGGGGGGGVSFDYFAPGAGGGAGGVAEAILRLSAGTYNITVGAAGSGGSNGSSDSGPSSGGNGGSSSFHTYITCSGGFGGYANYYVNYESSDQSGLGGFGSFNTSDFDGFLYADGQLGGAGGRRMIETYYGSSPDGLKGVFRGFAGGEGESGGPASFPSRMDAGSRIFAGNGGGGGGYNRPFIYGSGRGVGTGGDGGGADGSGGQRYRGSPGQPGAVVIEWN